MSTGTKKPTNFERKLLIKYNRFKDVESIPEFVSNVTLSKVRAIYKLRIATYLTVAAFFGGVGAAHYSKYQKEQHRISLNQKS